MIIGFNIRLIFAFFFKAHNVTLILMALSPHLTLLLRESGMPRFAAFGPILNQLEKHEKDMVFYLSDFHI